MVIDMADGKAKNKDVKKEKKDAKTKEKGAASAPVTKENKEKKKTGGLSRLVRTVKGEKKPEREKLVQLGRDPYDILKFVLMTEKSVRQIELQNKLVFIVDRSSDKDEIKAAASLAFNSPISEVRTVIDQAGRKKAFVRFEQEGAAGEIAIRLGII